MTPTQISAANMLARELTKGGHMTFDAPTGTGKTLIMCEALKTITGRVLIITRRRELATQFYMMAERCDLPLADYVIHIIKHNRGFTPSTDVSLAVRYMDASDVTVDHPNVLTVL